MATTIGNLKSLIAAYLGRTSVSDLTVNSFDLGLFGLNAARRKAERLADFRYAEIDGALAIATTGTLLSAMTGLLSGATVKRVKDVSLPVSDGSFPIEFLTEDEWANRVKRQVGRSIYSASSTLADLGVSNANPICYQQAQKLFLVPASQFTFPVSAGVTVVQFMPDYTADANTDFFTQWAPEYLQWEAILEINRHFRRFMEKQEGNLDVATIQAAADTELQSLLAWNASLDSETSTPPGTPRQ